MRESVLLPSAAIGARRSAGKKNTRNTHGIAEITVCLLCVGNVFISSINCFISEKSQPMGKGRA